jgi:phospholipid/cholesterol/gamma-HCH transport system substrate-binding protein
MMAERKIEVSVGLTVTVAILVLILGLIWGKGMKLFSSRMEYVARFDNVKGLEKGDPVVVRGVDQGQVEKVVLQLDFAEVHFWTKRDIALYADATVTVENQELMGGKQISIDPGQSKQRVESGFCFDGQVKGDLDDLMTKTDQIFSSLDTVLSGLKTFLDPLQFKGVIRNLEMSTIELQRILKENRQMIHASIQRIDHFTEQIEEDSTAMHVQRIVCQLDSTAILMHHMMTRIETQEGTIGKLVHDRKLYDRLVLVSSHLDSLITDIHRSPKRYFHVSVF